MLFRSVSQSRYISSDLVAAGYSFCKRYISLDGPCTVLSDLIDRLICCFFTNAPTIEQFSIAESSFVRPIADFWSRIMDSELVSSFRSLILVMASNHFFSKDFAKHVYGVLGKPVSMNMTKMIEFILDAIDKLLVIGTRLINGESFSKILLGESPVSECLSEMDELLKYNNRIYSGIPVPGFIHRNDFITRCDEVLSAFNCLEKEMGLSKKYISLSAKASELWKMRHAEMTIACGDQRPCPFGIVLCGAPGIGKTTLLDLCSGYRDWETDRKSTRLNSSHRL